jgi:tRNA1(Val) A37 N6-methylase TrmN6
MAQMATATLQKTLGAFYTGQSAADRLVRWAICDGSESVLDPSCGDGVFLGGVHSRLRVLGSDSPEVYGVDIFPDALRLARERVEGAHLIQDDFFNLTPESLRHFDCVVGNPPFIRYQTFNGDTESLAHRRAREAGVDLPRLASSWAPFLIHASRFLRRGGRLGMVMPSELGHSMYAREVLRFLVENFRHVAVEMFRDKLFEELNQSTVLLFCEGYGESNRAFFVMSSDDLEGNERQVAEVDIALIKNGRFRFTRYLVPPKVRSLYESLAESTGVKRLGDVADVGIGYVTGANDFFHLSAEECRRWEIPKKFLRPCVLNLRGFKGLKYDHQQWKDRRGKGEKVYLLALPPTSAKELPSCVQAYLRDGESRGLQERYKCRVRQRWFAVPHVRIGDAFLSYMSGEQPLLVTNAAHLVAPNTVHILRFKQAFDPLSYAASWRSSLTRLSCELEGHALGGGLFKLEPSEAESVLVAHPRAAPLRNLMSRVSRGGLDSPEQFSNVADQYLLRKHLGLSLSECESLRDAAGKIESWRKHK